MSANKYLREGRIVSCKNKMIIRNLSKKKFTVIVRSDDGEEITKDDFHITMTGDGSWSLDVG
jgi:hypothetical protein